MKKASNTVGNRVHTAQGDRFRPKPKDEHTISSNIVEDPMTGTDDAEATDEELTSMAWGLFGFLFLIVVSVVAIVYFLW